LANIQSQKKRNRTNEKRRQKNSQVKSAVRTSAKKLSKALEPGKDVKAVEVTEVETLFLSFVKTIDSAAGKRIYHKNTAARKKSRLMKRINALKKVSAV